MDALVKWVDQKIDDLDLRKFMVAQLFAHFWIFVIFLVLTPATLLWWENSLPWLQFLSLFAIVWTGATGVAGAVAALFALRADEAVETPSVGVEGDDPSMPASPA